jgi:lysophospholipase L1-like esterase
MWPQAQRANELVRDYCGRGPHLHYVDVASILLGADGRPDPSLYLPDALHLNEAGYAAWTRLLTRVLAELGG